MNIYLMIDLFYVTSRKYRKVFSLNCSVREQLTFPTIFDISYSYFRHTTVPCRLLCISLYDINKSVLVESRPLVKFTRNYIWESSGVFSISSLVRIWMPSSSALTLSYSLTHVQEYSSHYNKKKITWWLEYMNFIFSW